MEQLYKLTWVVLLIICVPAVIKTAILAKEKKAAARIAMYYKCSSMLGIGQDDMNRRAAADRAMANSAAVYRLCDTAPAPFADAPGAAAIETGPMVYYANDSRGNRDNEYQFNYIKTGGSWRAYILKMPVQGKRDPGCAVTHILYDEGRPYVCWDGAVTSLKDMQTISRDWADAHQEHIVSGKRFG